MCSAPEIVRTPGYPVFLALFRDAPFYAWANAKAFMDILSRLPEKKDNPQAPNPFDLIKTDLAADKLLEVGTTSIDGRGPKTTAIPDEQRY